ncbi:hypothetical protein GGI15_001873 [Coemansia interrupta]|uniref:Uncharacterized protein n=1 Tax=Coemansia interrupta TaxID=1126814 RepID=A0A9W8HI16_9FUNG|nr:hypothetical protein GGI15_001873 [Coemansia interrupta]
MVLNLHDILTGDAAEYQMLEENPPLSISFPKLEVLNVTGDTLQNPGIVIQRYPKRIRQLNLQLSSTSLFMLSSWGFESIDELTVKIYAVADDEYMFYKATNYFFGSGMISGKSSLCTGDFSHTLDPDCIEWRNISSITVSGTVLYSTLTTIISQIPNLESIVIWSLDTSDCIASVPNTASCQGGPPLSSSIELLTILDFPNLSDRDQISQSILMLALQLPRLKVLSTAKFIVNAIKDHGAIHKEIPHLDFITYIGNNFIR